MKTTATTERNRTSLAGQRVSTTTCPLPPGPVHGTVSLYEPDETYKSKSEVVYAFKYEKVGILVASYSARIPGKQRPTRPETERPSPLTSCSLERRTRGRVAGLAGP